jgi:hypothetical protein
VLAAGGRLVVGERLADGGRRIVAIDPRTHVFVELTRFAAPADPLTYHVLKLAGSGGIVTATLDTFHVVTDSTAEQATPVLLTSRAFTVLPALATLATCDPVDPAFPSSIHAAGGDGFVALTADDCGKTSAVHVRTPEATHTIPVEVGAPSRRRTSATCAPPDPSRHGPRRASTTARRRRSWPSAPRRPRCCCALRGPSATPSEPTARSWPPRPADASCAS